MAKKLTTNKIIFSTPNTSKMAMNPALAKKRTTDAPKMILGEFSLLSDNKYMENIPVIQVNKAKKESVNHNLW